MISKHLYNHIFYTTLTAAASLFSFSPSSFAQEISNDSSANEEEVVVVGSRINRSEDFEKNAPIATFDREAIEKSGYANLQQMLEKIPSAGNGTFSTRGNNQDSTANGAAAVSLRGLGADATLLLVNGRRIAISAFAESITTNFVDINAIPVSAIERIEVLKDGASAVYGSDAVAGVVNVVLRKDYEGFEVTASYGNTTDKDADERHLSAIWGVNGDNNANMTVVVDYFKNGVLMNADRDGMGTANQSARGGEDFRSSRGFPGRFVVDGETTIDPNCPASSTSGNTCVYDYGPWNVLIPEAERIGAIVSGRRDITQRIKWFAEMGFQHNTSMAQGAPTPLDEDAQLTVPVTHPNNPFTNATSIQISRYRPVDAGARRWDIETDNMRLLTGIQVDLSSGWNLEIAAQNAYSHSLQTGNRSQGWVRTDLLQREINAGRYNPFGGITNPDDVIQAITTSLVREGQSRLTSIDGSITGELFSLPGGALSMAAGFEYRKEKAEDVPDDQFQRGLIFGTDSVSASAQRDITSAFSEFVLPLLKNLELTLAGRFDEYSDFGSTTNPMANIRWTVSDSFALRSSWGTGFRAPSLAQIGLGDSQESRFFTDTFGCDENPAYCASTDYVIKFSGNPDLKPEESESINIGMVADPTDTLSISVDYWQIKQKQKIDQAPLGYTYNQHCNNQESDICIRTTPIAGDRLGTISEIKSGFINIGEQDMSGIDLSLLSTTGMPVGELTIKLDYSYLISFDRKELTPEGDGFITRDLAGEYEYPEHRWQLGADWQAQNWGVNATINYVGEFEDTPDIDFDGTLDFEKNESRTVKAFTTFNLQTRYSGIAKTQITLGIDNVFDTAPPFAIGDGDTDLYGYASSQHDPRGRFVYSKLTYTF